MKNMFLLLCFTISILNTIDVSGQWVQMCPTILAANESPVPTEGSEVAISADGMTMASLWAYNHSTLDSGVVAIYRRNGQQWQKQTVIYPELIDDGSNYRSCLALSANGNTLAIYNGTRNWVAVYFYDGGVWRLQSKFICRGPQANSNRAYSGIAISYDGNTVFCNAQIFVRTNGAWSLQQTLLPLDRPVASNPGFVPYYDTANHFSACTGSALSANGNTAVVCDNYGPDTTFNLWVFTRNGSNWAQQGSRLQATHHETWRSGDVLAPPDISISGDGNTIALNTTSYSGWGISVFRKIGSVWTEQTTTLLGDPQQNTAGRNVDLAFDGNSFITATASGIYYYRYTGGSWARVGSHSIYAPMDTFERLSLSNASALALDSSGLNAILGMARFKQTKGGTFYFTLSDTIWSQTGTTIFDSIDAGGSFFGFSTAISADGSTIAGGGYKDDGWEGAVWVYRRNGSEWAQYGSKLWIHDQRWHSSWFGYSVALSGDGSTLAVGSPLSNSPDPPSVGSGAIYIYTRSGNGYVPQGDSIVAPNIHGLGYYVSIADDGNSLVTYSSDSGVVLFVRNAGVWTKQRTFHTSSSGGARPVISGDGSTIAIGDPAANNQVGGVTIYYRNGSNWILQTNALKPASITTAGYSYPSAICISKNGDYVAASSPYFNWGNGNIYCYVRNGSNWSVRDSVAPFSGNDLGHGYGVQISATGDTICEIQRSGTYNASGINMFSRTSGHWSLAASVLAEPMEYYWRQLSSIAATPDARYIAVGIPQNRGCLDGELRVFKSSSLIDSLILKKDATCMQVANGKIVVRLRGGLQPYKYAWSNGAPNADSITNLIPGTYSVTLTDNGGDTIVRSYNVGSVMKPTRAGYSYTFNCSNGLGTILVSSAGGTAPYTYLWNTNPAQSTNPAVNLQPSFYTYVAIDSNGCTYTDSAAIPATPYSINISGTQPHCGNNGSITAIMPGGANPFTYVWSNGANTSINNGLSAGTYSVTITDTDNCIVTGTYTLNYSCSSVIEGNVYFDHNGNCQFDTLQDHRTPNANMVAEHNGYNVYGTTNANGDYFIVAPDSGAYSVSIGSLIGCDVLLCGGNSYPVSVTIPHAGDTITNVDFGIDIHNYNLWLQASTNNQPFPGSPFDFNLYYGDLVDSLVPNGTITVSYDSLLVFNSSNPSYTTHDVVNRIITWGVSNISLYNPQSITLHFTVPVTSPVQAQTVVNASITPVTSDCNANNNILVMPVYISGAFDPNYKEASPSGAIFPGDSIITYTIHFQNTGVDSTHFIEVIDTLSSYVDPGSVRTVATSHYPYTFSVSGKGILSWKFDPLALPDSATDYLNSQGFIIYQVTTNNNLSLGTMIKNNASIYFDYNIPVITNTTINTVSQPSGIVSTGNNNVKVTVFPNPFSSFTRFNVAGNIEKYDITIKDVLGRVVAEFSGLSESTVTFNRQGLAAGCYIYSVANNNKLIARGKLVVE